MTHVRNQQTTTLKQDMLWTDEASNFKNKQRNHSNCWITSPALKYGSQNLTEGNKAVSEGVKAHI